jgi:drug/metabolite transporter (DMT)-like permease
MRKRFDAVEIMLGLFAIAGILVIYETHLHFSAGIIIGLLSSVLTVVVSVLNKKIVDRHRPEDITLYQLTGGFIGLSLLLPLFRYFFTERWTTPTAFDWLWLIVLSWVCTIFTFFLYIRALRSVSAFTMNLTLTLEPVYGIILAFLIYHENKHFSPWFYVGFALIAVAVVFHMWRLLKPAKQKSAFR